MTSRVLVAGIGNIFLGDDGFGSEVAARLARVDLPAGVRVVDYGIRGMHLAYDLANGFDAAILIDATPRGGAPGTLYLIEPDLGSGSPAATAADAADTDADDTDDTAAAGHATDAHPLFDAHGMQPDVVFGMLDMLGGGRPGRILIVGCEPASVDYGMGLSDAVAASVDEAVRVVAELAADGCVGWAGNQEAAATGAQGAGGSPL
ncbi:MAG TPA: hydrogenase maturation protease [Streptosporangiaceae bacterium]|nr:hydrogenase maturation protease [Streptosporangiaceae bacterium]